MVKNLSILGLVAFGVSFGLSLLVNRDIKTAFLTGLITVPASFSGIVAVNSKQRTKQKRLLTPLQNQIHQLKRRETQLIQSLSATVTEKQRTEANLNFLKAELSQFYTQIAEQRSNKQQLNQDLIALGEHKGQLESESQDLKAQIHNLKERKEELYQSLRSINTQKQNAKASSKSLPVELKQLQAQIAERQYQKEESERGIAFFTTLNSQLEEQSQKLEAQIQELEKDKAELSQSLSALTATEHITKNSIDSLQAELAQLQEQVTQQNNKKELEQQLINAQEQRLQLKVVKKQIERLPDEWNDFMLRLPKYEFQVLKAVVEHGNPSLEIKNIAEENITMPELLIDLVNKRALNTIGDLIIEPGRESFPPIITAEYLTNVKKVIAIKQMS